MRRSIVWCVVALGACGSEVFVSPRDKTPEDTDVPDVAAPDIAVSPATLRFGGVVPDCTSASQTITLSNVGTAALVIDSVDLEGPDKRAYTLSTPLLNLGEGETTDVFVEFEPRQLGDFEDARVVIQSNDPDEATVKVGLEGQGSNERIAEDTFLQEQSDGVDVLFLLDKSSSMSSDIDDLKLHFSTFINTFVNLGLDYHLGVMSIDDGCATLVGPIIDNSTADPATEFTKQIETSFCNDKEATFDAVRKAFSPPLSTGANAGFLRPDANLALVVFSDEPEQSGEFLSRPSPMSFVNYITSLKGGDASKVSLSGLVGPETVNEAANCLLRANPALPDSRYHNAIRQSGGYLGRICNVRVQPFLQLLSKTASGLTFTFPLSEVPTSTDPGDWEVSVDGKAVASGATDGWSYDTLTSEIVVDGTAVPQPGQVLTVRYPAEAGCD